MCTIYMYVHVQYIHVQYTVEPLTVDTSLIRSLAFFPIAVILYKTTPELRTPLQSGQLDGSQWCPQYRGSTVHVDIYPGSIQWGGQRGSSPPPILQLPSQNFKLLPLCTLVIVLTCGLIASPPNKFLDRTLYTWSLRLAAILWLSAV